MFRRIRTWLAPPAALASALALAAHHGGRPRLASGLACAAAVLWLLSDE